MFEEIIKAVARVVGAQRLGVRFAPLVESTEEDRGYLGLVEHDPHATYIEAIKLLEKAGIAYLSLAEADWDLAPELPITFRQAVRETFSGMIMYSGKYSAKKAIRVLTEGFGDIFGFGRQFIANPDLPDRLRNGWPMNSLELDSLYGGSKEGYSDYPTYSPQAK